MQRLKRLPRDHFIKVPRVIPICLAPLLLGLAITGIAISSGNAATGHSSTPQDFKVAFIGDQGLGSNSVAVLNLIKEERTDMVLHQGDFDYFDDPEEWDQQINDVLIDRRHPSFPSALASVERDGDVQGDPIDPGGEPVLRVIPSG